MLLFVLEISPFFNRMWLVITAIIDSYLPLNLMRISDAEKVVGRLQFLACKSSMHFFISERYVSTLLLHLAKVMLNKSLHNRNSALNPMAWYKLPRIIHIARVAASDRNSDGSPLVWRRRMHFWLKFRFNGGSESKIFWKINSF